jgi:hypothetical protein
MINVNNETLQASVNLNEMLVNQDDSTQDIQNRAASFQNPQNSQKFQQLGVFRIRQ